MPLETQSKRGLLLWCLRLTQFLLTLNKHCSLAQLGLELYGLHIFMTEFKTIQQDYYAHI